MKKIYILIALLSTLHLGYSQEEGGPDTTRFRIGSLEFIIVDRDTMVVDNSDEDGNDKDKNFGINKNKKTDLEYWSGLDIGINMLMNNQFESKFTESHLKMDPANSFSFSFNFFEKRIPFGQDYFGLVTGLGFTNSRFGLKDDRLRIGSNADSTFGLVDTTLTSGFTKNQLRVNYFNIPILFHINTSLDEKKNFHMSFGVIGGVRMTSKMVYKYDVFGGETKDKTKGRYNVNPFQLALTARMGFRDFGVFANFDMLPLFDNGTSRVAKPLTFGASFNF